MQFVLHGVKILAHDSRGSSSQTLDELWAGKVLQKEALAVCNLLPSHFDGKWQLREGAPPRLLKI